MPRRYVLAFGFASAFSLFATGASAQTTRELKVDLPLDGALTVTTLGFVVASEERKFDLAPEKCRWCDRDAAGNDTLNGFDRGARRALKWRDMHTASVVSDVTAFLLTPFAGYGMLAAGGIRDRAEATYTVDALLVLEAFAIAEAANEIAKYAAARERPFVHARLHDERKTKKPHPDDNLSFYSGHTSIAFSVATASGTVAELRGYRLAPLVWAASLPGAVLTAYLRVAADRHYASDVLVGAVMGSAVGVLLPLLFHGRRDDRVPPIENADDAALRSVPQTISFGGAF